MEWGEGKRRGVGRRKGAPLLRPYFALFSDWRANVDPVPALDRAALPKLLTRIRDERQVRAVVTSSPRLRPSSHGAGHRNLCSKYNSLSPGIPGIPVNFILVFKNWGGDGGPRFGSRRATRQFVNKRIFSYDARERGEFYLSAQENFRNF